MKIKNHLLGMMAIASLLARRNSHPKFQTSVDVVEGCKKELVALKGKNENVDGPICKTTLKVCVGLYDSVGKKVVSFLSWYYEKMKTSISARKLLHLF